jgi:aspartate carbamoyltransferase catalytic subunit
VEVLVVGVVEVPLLQEAMVYLMQEELEEQVVQIVFQDHQYLTLEEVEVLYILLVQEEQEDQVEVEQVQVHHKD